jgi:uncharacterized phage protein gp47/JayE
MDLPSRLDLFAKGVQYIQQSTGKLDPRVPLTQGSDANMYLGSTTVVADAITKQIGYNLARLLLDTATGDDLDRYALDRYQLTRKGAAPAVGSVTISRATVAAGAGSVALGTVLTTLSGAQYFTTSIATFGPSTYSATCTVSASQAGAASQVGANAVSNFLQPSQLFDASLTVNNPVPMAGGADAEDDDTFRNRIRNFWNTARRGTLGAIQQGALNTLGVDSALAVEALTGLGAPARVVNLYIADASGVANATLAQAVLNNLLDYRAGGITVIISTSIPLLVPIGILLAYQTGVDSVSLASQVQAAVFNFVNTLGVNGTLQLSDLYTILTRYKQQGVIVQTPGSIVNPAGDLVPPIGQTIRTTLGLVSIGSL